MLHLGATRSEMQLLTEHFAGSMSTFRNALARCSHGYIRQFFRIRAEVVHLCFDTESTSQHHARCHRPGLALTLDIRRIPGRGLCLGRRSAYRQSICRRSHPDFTCG